MNLEELRQYLMRRRGTQEDDDRLERLYSSLPIEFINEDDIAMLDRLFDRLATVSRWSNRDVADAVCKLIRYITTAGKEQ